MENTPILGANGQPAEDSQVQSTSELIASINALKTGEFWEIEYLLDCYNMWLMAVQAHEKKVHLLKMNVEPSEEQLRKLACWDENSTFEEWLSATRELLVEVQIPEIKKKLSMPYSADYLSPMQMQLASLSTDKSFSTANPQEMEKLDRTWHELDDWAFHHQVETIDKYMRGTITLGEDMLVKRMIETETGKIDLDAIKRMGAMLGFTDKKEMMKLITSENAKESVVEKLRNISREKKKQNIHIQ